MPDGERRAAILRVAGALFRQRGYAAVSLAEVAAGVGVTKATVLHHFGSKEALYAAVMRDALDRIGAAIRQTAADPGPVPDKLRRLAQTAIVFVDADADLDAMLHDADEHLGAPSRRSVDDAHRTILAAIEEVMRRGIAEGDLAERHPRLLAHAFWHLLGGFGGRRGAQAAFQGRPEIADAVVDLFLHGAAGAPRAP
jgi:AcrR family transcriptional regulator